MKIELNNIQLQFLWRALEFQDAVIDFENTDNKEFMECYFTTKKKFKLELNKLKDNKK